MALVSPSYRGLNRRQSWPIFVTVVTWGFLVGLLFMGPTGSTGPVLRYELRAHCYLPNNNNNKSFFFFEMDNKKRWEEGVWFRSYKCFHPFLIEMFVNVSDQSINNFLIKNCSIK